MSLILYCKGGEGIGSIYNQSVLILLLIIAVLTDFKYDRILNGLTVFGILLGFCMRIWENGWYDILNAIFPMMLSFILLYPIYKIGGMGAGDVKLFCMIGSFVSAGRLLHLMLCSFIVGAFISAGKILSQGNWKERAQYFLSYLMDMLHDGQWKLYGDDLLQDERQYKSNKIHFALPVLISVMLEAGGLF